MATTGRDTVTALYDALTGDEDARVCKDVPEAACRELPGNFLRHLGSFSATKIGDELASARLVLPWLLSLAAAPGWVTGLLVPIREAGALLPQLVVAALIRRRPVRKGFWVAGSIAQGVCVLGMAVAAVTWRGLTAGAAVLALLALFSVARGVCSVAAKDVLGKTVSRERRGTLMGWAGSAAGVVTLAVGLWLGSGAGVADDRWALFGVLAAAAVLWLLAAVVFASLREEPGATAGGGNALTEALASLGLLRDDAAFRRFVLARTLLLGSALLLPFYTLLAGRFAGDGLAGLGGMIVAGGLAGVVASPFWGRRADRSSRGVMTASAVLAAAVAVLVLALMVAARGWLAWPWLWAGVFFLGAMAHAGARLGRKTYLVDLGTTETRAAYTAVSNTVIGVMLLAYGAISALLQLAGTEIVIAALAASTLAAAVMSRRLPEA